MNTSAEARDIIFDWWRENLDNENDGNARALSARLRRATIPLEALSERAVQELGVSLKLGFQPEKLALLAMTLAQVHGRNALPIAKCFGEVMGQSGEGKQRKNKYKLSETRFQNIIRAETSSELATQLRRALPLIENTCNVRKLGQDLLLWDHPEIGERIRARWWFDYFGGVMPTTPEPESSDKTSEHEEAAQ